MEKWIPRDGDTLVTKDNFIFYVFGYTHPEERVFSFLKYIPSNFGWTWDAWQETCRRLERRVRRSVRRVQIFLRNVKEEDGEDSWTFAENDAEEEKVITQYGLAMPGSTFLIPYGEERNF